MPRSSAAAENAGLAVATTTAEPLRAASKNERRPITRHALGFYNALIMAGLYNFDLEDAENSFDVASADSYTPALKYCIAKHPILATGIIGEETESPLFGRVSRMDLRKFVRIIEYDSVAAAGVSRGKSDEEDETEFLKRVMLTLHDRSFENVETVPPWRVTVIPLPASSTPGSEGEKRGRAYIIFSYSHSHGDGRSGLVFHRTFLRGLHGGHRIYDQSHVYTPTVASEALPLPPPLEEACTFTITWSYLLLSFLLTTLLGNYIPAFVKLWLKFQTPTPTTETWTGQPIIYDPDNFRTGCEILMVKKDRMNAILRICREKGGAKFTGLLNQVVVRALGVVLPRHSTSPSFPSSTAGKINFISGLVIDLRHLVPAYTDSMMVNCVSALFEQSTPCSSDKNLLKLKDDEPFWTAVRNTTTRLAASSSTLTDQPMGLLKYLDEFRPWYLQKIGQERESSYEISNAVIFDPDTPISFPEDAEDRSEAKSENKKTWDISRMIFSQPANATNSPLSFSIVTRKNGDMVLTLTWQTGAGVLGVHDEDVFAKELLVRIDGLLGEVAGGTI
ncbi:alcohol acetyltransferase [Aspergillus californicus]